MAAWLRVLFGIFGLPLTIVFCDFVFFRRPPTAWVAFNTIAWAVVLYASIAAHEFGHAIVGHVVGLRPRIIYFGVGREFARFRLGELELRFNALPLLGLTIMAARSPRWLRLRFFLAIAAGPAMTGAILAGLLTIPPAQRGAFNLQEGSAVYLLAMIANLVMLVSNLWPITFSAGFRSDGRLMLSMPWIRSSTLQEILTGHFIVDAMTALERHELVDAMRFADEALAQYPDSFGARNMKATLKMEMGRHAEARDEFVALLGESNSLDPQQHLILSNNLAWADFVLDDPTHLEEADAHSGKVFRKFGSASFALATRGAILNWSGKSQEACGLLERAYLTNSSNWSRALNACCLVLAYAKRGDQVRAREWLEKAQRDDPKCSLLPRAHAALQPSP